MKRTDDLNDLYEAPLSGLIIQARKDRRRLYIGAGLVALLVAMCALSPARATPWTDEDGNPNPECLSSKCHETGVKDKPIGIDPEPREPSTQWAEVHNGFICRVGGVVRYHAAARLVMTQEHLDAAKAEADAKVKSGALIKDCPADLKARIIASDDWVQE